MSIVIGLVTHPDSEGHFVTYLGFDSLVTTDTYCDETTADKAFVLRVEQPKLGYTKALGIGICGAPVYNSFLRHSFSPPPFHTGCEDPSSNQSVLGKSVVDKYIYSQLIPAIAAEESERNSKMNLEASKSLMMLSFCGLLYTVDSYYNTVRTTTRYAAIGMGEEIALGALSAYERMYVDGWTDEQTVQSTLDIVASRSITCGAGLKIITVLP